MPDFGAAVVPILFMPWRWLALHDLMSFVLLLFGLGCFLLGAWKGRLHDDPFWGYGKITRTALASVAARDALCEDLKKSVHAHVNNVRDKLKAAYDQDAASLQAHREALAAAERKVLDNGGHS